MKATFKLDNVDDIEATIVLTATLRDWRYILRDLKVECGQSQKLRSVISDVIEKAEKHLWSEGDAPNIFDETTCENCGKKVGSTVEGKCAKCQGGV